MSQIRSFSRRLGYGLASRSRAESVDTHIVLNWDEDDAENLKEYKRQLMESYREVQAIPIWVWIVISPIVSWLITRFLDWWAENRKMHSAEIREMQIQIGWGN